MDQVRVGRVTHVLPCIDERPVRQGVSTFDELDELDARASAPAAHGYIAANNAPL